MNNAERVNKHIKEHYDVIKVQLPKGSAEKLREKAKSKGLKGTQTYIKELIKQDFPELFTGGGL